MMIKVTDRLAGDLSYVFNVFLDNCLVTELDRGKFVDRAIAYMRTHTHTSKKKGDPPYPRRPLADKENINPVTNPEHFAEFVMRIGDWTYRADRANRMVDILIREIKPLRGRERLYPDEYSPKE